MKCVKSKNDLLCLKTKSNDNLVPAKMKMQIVSLEDRIWFNKLKVLPEGQNISRMAKIAQSCHAGFRQS